MRKKKGINLLNQGITRKLKKISKRIKNKLVQKEKELVDILIIR